MSAARRHRRTAALTDYATAVQERSEVTEAPETEPLPPAGWSGTIVTEGQPTGDGRMIALNALYWEDLPIPLRYVASDVGAHDGAMAVGRILTLTRRGNGDIHATGDFDLGSVEGREAARQVAAGVKTGVSVDLDDVAFEVRIAAEAVEAMIGAEDPDGEPDPDSLPDMESVDEDGRVVVAEMTGDEELMVTTEARVRAATLVDIPAFVNARISADTEDEALTAAVSGDTDLPVADRDREWSGDDAARRVIDAATGEDGSVDTEQVARAFLWNDPDADPATRGAWSLGFADIVDDTLMIIPAGVAATAGGRGVDAADIPEADRNRVKTRICALYDTVRDTYEDWPECPFSDDDDDADSDDPDDSADDADSDAAAGHRLTVVAGGYPRRPPAEWFTDPGLDRPTGLTVTDEGRVYGHLAAWGTCHVAHPRECVEPPASATSYAYFETGAVTADDGQTYPTGRITLDTLHANDRLTATATSAHYENTGVGVADVCAGEDDHGIWVSGALRPGVTDAQVRALRASPLSGDWRRIGGNLELVAALAVNVPGFPIPRAHGLVASGEVTALVASGIVDAPPAATAATAATDLFTPEETASLRALAAREREAERHRRMAVITRTRARLLAGRVRRN